MLRTIGKLHGKPGVAVRSTTVERCNPTINAATATINPANGPATPISNSARRSRIGPRIRMMAPNVPMKCGGPGMNSVVAMFQDGGAFMWAILALPAGLGLFSASLSRDGRGLHDRFAGTRVVRADA